MSAGAPDRIAEALRKAPPSASGVLCVDLAAMRRNYRTLKSAAAGASVAGVVKADGYGLGASEAATALAAEGCKVFFVATLVEAEAVRGRLPEDAHLFVLNGLPPGTAAQFGAVAACPVIGDILEFEEWVAHAKRAKDRTTAALHFDTGMSRLGFAPAEAEAILRHPALSAVDLRLVMTHLACADDATNPKNTAQLALFNQLAEHAPESAWKSVAASAGIFLGPAYCRDLVRPGVALYGGRAASAGPNPMAPVVSLYGRIAQVRWAERGETVGYGATHTLKRRTKIATVMAGYADGFFRALAASDARDGPAGHIGAHRLPLLGRVSMDLITFDATDAPEALVQRGGFVEILGERVTVDDLADFAGTIGYEILTALGSRYHRVYLDD